MKKLNLELLIMKGVVSELEPKDKELYDWGYAKMKACFDELQAREKGLGGLVMSVITCEALKDE